jgi:hypothetical protein
MTRLCKCGCGNDVTRKESQFIRGHFGRGKHRSYETKKKISEKLSGDRCVWFGRKHTDETKKKISESLRGKKNGMFGKHHSEEVKQKIKNSSWNKGLTKETDMRLKNIGKQTSKTLKKLWEDPIYIAKMSKCRKDMWKNKKFYVKMCKIHKLNQSSERIANIRLKMNEYWKDSKHINIASEISKKRWQNPQYHYKTKLAIKRACQNKKRCLEISKRMKKKWKDQEYIEHISKKRKSMWKNKAYRRKKSKSSKNMWNDLNFRQRVIPKVMRAVHRSPNHFESKIIQIIKLNRLLWKYVGNGSFLLAGKNPDFIYLGKEKIVAEAYDNYWKSLKGCTPKKYIRERSMIFKKEGFQTIFIHYNDTNENILYKLLGVY